MLKQSLFTQKYCSKFICDTQILIFQIVVCLFVCVEHKTHTFQFSLLILRDDWVKGLLDLLHSLTFTLRLILSSCGHFMVLLRLSDRGLSEGTTEGYNSGHMTHIMSAHRSLGATTIHVLLSSPFPLPSHHGDMVYVLYKVKTHSNRSRGKIILFKVLNRVDSRHQITLDLAEPG